MHALDPESGASRYLRWQHTWWSGKYSIMLTKVCFLHRKYLEAYFEVAITFTWLSLVYLFHVCFRLSLQMIPKALIESIDAHRNCEDLAMAHVVAFKVRTLFGHFLKSLSELSSSCA
jgi:hypothetical protein